MVIDLPTPACASSNGDAAVSRFQDLLRIRTVHPEPAYAECVEWLRAQAKELGLQFQTVEPVSGLPVAIMTLGGKKKEETSLMLYCHMDVVPVALDRWEHDPFAAEIHDGKIYARGSQDMKCVGAAYLEALRHLRTIDPSWQPERTVHFVWGPDEEIGGEEGVRAWVDDKTFNQLNVGFALDEGIANPAGPDLRVFYAERSPWWLMIRATGPEGHGSQFHAPTAPEKLNRIAGKVLAFHEVQRTLASIGKRPQDGRQNELGDVTTLNLTKLSAGEGKSFNIVPGVAEAGFDIRVSPWVDKDKFEAQIKEWCSSEEGVTYRFEQYWNSSHVTSLDDDNFWYKEIQRVAASRNIGLHPEVFPAATDSRFVRAKGVPALGISYLPSLPALLHQHNEYIPVQTFLDSIPFYADLIVRLSSAGLDGK